MLASVEIGTLITALGCGIGREEFSADKLRYHRIIIMTDADVDGAHITTLLLTFFYRQMLELVEKGYVYIAQPPLYKVKKGKQEQYLKNDEALESYLIQNALDNTQLFPAENAPAISAVALEDLIKHYQTAMTIIRRLSKRYPESILKSLVVLPVVNAASFANKESMFSWLNGLEKNVSCLNTSKAIRYRFELIESAETSQYFPKITLIEHGIERNTLLNKDFFASGEYRILSELSTKLHGFIQKGAYIKRDDKDKPIESFEEAYGWLIEQAKKGQYIQRYKGLGEMNPDQLWETTMDPSTRRLLQVTIQDAVEADQIFTTLMGDAVEPRREFIEKNALNVENIDI
jgi:DNA gyrase subunit B